MNGSCTNVECPPGAGVEMKGRSEMTVLSATALTIKPDRYEDFVALEKK